MGVHERGLLRCINARGNYERVEQRMRNRSVAEGPLDWFTDEEEDSAKPAGRQIYIRKQRNEGCDDGAAPGELDPGRREDKEIKRFSEGDVSGRGHWAWRMEQSAERVACEWTSNRRESIMAYRLLS